MNSDKGEPRDEVRLAMEGEISVSDVQRFGSGENVRGAEEDSDEFFSTCSHFSHDRETSGPTPNNEVDQILSEAENQRLNVKIDRLMAALDGGRQVRFKHNPVTGYFDVSVSRPSLSSSVRSDKLEADITATPQNFGNIVSSRSQMLRSPNSIKYAMASSSLSSEIRHITWEEAITAADEKYDRENGISFADREDKATAADLFFELGQGASLQNEVKIRRALRLQEQALEEPRGGRLAVFGPSGVEIHQICPIPLDFQETLQTSTPSIYSSDSQDVSSSPLFRLSYPDMVRYADSWATASDSDGDSEHVAPTDRISEWLERLETPPQVRTPVLLGGKSKDFRVFRDATAGKGSSQGIQDSVSTDKILRDVSNLRRPGYLQHNSFAQKEKSPASPPQAAGSALPPHTISGASATEGRRSFIKSKWPGLLSPVPEQDSPAPLNKPLDHPERVAQFELALARLEGRAPPEPSSPIRRYVHNDGVYGEDVEVDLRVARFRQPRPVRYTDEPGMDHQFKQALGEDVAP